MVWKNQAGSASSWEPPFIVLQGALQDAKGESHQESHPAVTPVTHNSSQNGKLSQGATGVLIYWRWPAAA